MEANEEPIRENELKIIALLSGMIRQYKETKSIDDVHNLICETANGILGMFERKGSNKNNKSIISCSHQSTEKTYHLKIEYNGDEYFYIAIVLEVDFRNDIHDPIIVSIDRGTTYWDCGKQLTEIEENEIKRMIHGCFLQPFLK